MASNGGSRVDLSAQDLRTNLQKGTDEVKIATLRAIIVSTLNGTPYPSLLMPIIQFVLPSKNKQLKKMLHFYWEVSPRLDSNGKLKQEMILVCNAIRNDLQHPNEYIRGSTLRFLQKVREPELLEPLIPAVRQCLEHRHSYVRKNAVFCIYTIFQHNEQLFSDAPEIIDEFLANEADATCKRNAFIMLSHLAPERAVAYLESIISQVSLCDELMQMAIIELIRRDARGECPRRATYIETVSELLASQSHAVKYEAALTLAGLTQNAAAVRAVAAALIELSVKASDNNVKLIVLDRLAALRARHEHVLDSLVTDLLRVLSSPDMDVRKKVLEMALEMISVRSVEEVVLVLKKELAKTATPGQDAASQYRQVLIQTLHACAVRFPEVASDMVGELMSFLGDANNPSAVDVISFVRELVERFPNLREDILARLTDSFPEFKSGKVYRGALWIVGDYCASVSSISSVMQQLRKVIGELPILAVEQRHLEQAERQTSEEENAANSNSSAARHATTRVRADGTYATETAFSTESVDARQSTRPPLRSLILFGDYYTAAVLSATLVKLVLRFIALAADSVAKNALRAEAMLIMTSIIRVGHSQFAATPIDEDSEERIMTCLQTLGRLPTSPAEGAEAAQAFLDDSRSAFARVLERERKGTGASEERHAVVSQPHELLSFRQLGASNADGDADLEDELSRATGLSATTRDDFISKLQRVVQLTGFSDPVYAEAYVDVHQFDILMDVLVVNQTNETLQNLNIEIATLGDLKLVERPSSYTLAPFSYQSIKATIKVSSTETGIIFGNIVYEGASGSGIAGSGSSRCVVFNDIHIDIMDYIAPSQVTETQFRTMWTEFEWENKVNVSTGITSLHEFLNHILKSTNMACLTPEASLAGECGFLSANLAARSLFGEDALANLSIEQLDDGSIQGHVRIRSKTQGIALSLGDKITTVQKGNAP